MRDAQPGAIHLKDYRPPAYLVDTTELCFRLWEDHALVEARLRLRRNPEAQSETSLLLHGEELELLRLELDGRALDEGDYRRNHEQLLLDDCPARFELFIRTRIRPRDNTALEGLYQSRKLFCTQCEAEGFRKISYYPDRPDVMSVYTVRVEADQARYPVLLSNGNLLDQGVDGERHWTLWHDPFPKPSYLFALVAGELACLQDRFVSCGGREVQLCIYVESRDIDKCGHAMRALKNAMRWDEQRFGREYDLDVFNIVAVDDFNMGAMENKSLNIFNTSCVLAHPDTTTDQAFQRVEAVVAHEYFHNWSGNRVSCRDWFQLSLKEGFTVYREAEFSSDMGSRTVKRIQDVALLRSVQFAEDGGPTAHPVRPDSFIEISNFYTVTIYEKGAEVVRMMHTLLGDAVFRRGTDLYFARHDGQAVTCEDFVRAMEDASGRDLTQFRLWYSQAGTPVLRVSDHWDEEAGEYTLTVEQSCGPSPGQPQKQPFVIPLAVGLLGDAGDLRLRLKAEEIDPEQADNTQRILELRQGRRRFTFIDLPERPVPSLLRGFSAPVRLEYPYSREQLAFLMARDSDGFCRWDAGQQLAVAVIREAADAGCAVDALLLNALCDTLEDATLDPAMVAEMWRLPTENTLAELADPVDVDAIHRGRERVKQALAQQQPDLLLRRYRELSETVEYQPDAAQIARRSLRNRLLSYLVLTGSDGQQLAETQYHRAGNMTDRLAALSCVVNHGEAGVASALLAHFYQTWQHEALVVNQWLQVQAMCPRADNLQRVRALMRHKAFTLRNPNKVRALIGGFCNANPVNFHRADGAGYQLLAEVVGELNQSNPQIAARLLTPLTRWRRYGNRAEAMRQSLQSIADLAALSPNVFEIVTTSLADQAA